MSKASRSLRVSSKGSDIVSSALIRKGWTQQILADMSGVSRSTISSFINGRSIDRGNFLEICHMLDLDSMDIIDSDQSDIKSEIEDYLSPEYQLVLQAKDQQIALLTQELIHERKRNDKLLELIELTTKNSRNINIYDSRIDVLNTSDNHSNTYNNSQDLSQAAKDIRKLLKQLEEDYHSDTIADKMTITTKAIEYIENDDKLAKKVLNALKKQGSIESLKSYLPNSLGGLLVAALEDWQKNKQ